MKLSDKLQRLNDSGDAGLMVDGYAEEARLLENQLSELLAAVKDDLGNRLANYSEKSCGHNFHCVCSGDRLNKAIQSAGITQ